MDTDSLIEKIRLEQKILSDAILRVFEAHGWTLDKKSSDIKGVTSEGFTMIIDDGTCPDVVDAVFHIYAPGKVFEGCVESVNEALCLMRMLGFEKQDGEQTKK